MKFIPFYERVLVKVLQGIRKIGEFELPDNARDEFLMGTVVSAGEGYVRDDGSIRPLRAQEGMTVLFGPHAGTPVKVDGQEYLAMKEGELVGRIEQ